MKEQLVSFETAKLAKEKGFDLNSECTVGFSPTADELTAAFWRAFGNNESSVPRPTQSLLQKWLREKHKLFVTVTIDPDQYRGLINYAAEVFDISVDREGLRILDGFTVYQTYEEALEEGLFETLKLVK